MIESEGPGYLVLANLELSTRVRLSRPLYEFVRLFREPSRVADLVPGEVRQRLKPQLEMLMAKHVLLDPDVEGPRRELRLRSNVAYRFCNSPAFDPRSPTDFTIIGLPCDSESDCDSRLAPEALRRKSLDYPFRRAIENNLPCGWFDADTGRWILKGASLSDAGDIAIEHGESQASLFVRVDKVLEECRQGGSTPIILGGDRGATETALKTVTGNGAPTIARLRADGSLAVPDIGKAIYLSIDLAIASAAYSDPRSKAAETLATLSDLKERVVALGRTNPIIAIDLVGLDMRGDAGRLGAALGCELALTAMEAACGSS